MGIFCFDAKREEGAIKSSDVDVDVLLLLH